jgi:hypothetical protein
MFQKVQGHTFTIAILPKMGAMIMATTTTLAMVTIIAISITNMEVMINTIMDINTGYMIIAITITTIITTIIIVEEDYKVVLTVEVALVIEEQELLVQ